MVKLSMSLFMKDETNFAGFAQPLLKDFYF